VKIWENQQKEVMRFCCVFFFSVKNGGKNKRYIRVTECNSSPIFSFLFFRENLKNILQPKEVISNRPPTHFLS
jgi:hypothetical protein